MPHPLPSPQLGGQVVLQCHVVDFVGPDSAHQVPVAVVEEGGEGGAGGREGVGLQPLITTQHLHIEVKDPLASPSNHKEVGVAEYNRLGTSCRHGGIGVEPAGLIIIVYCNAPRVLRKVC